MGIMNLIWTSVSVYTEKNMSSFYIYFIVYLHHILDILAHKYDTYLLFQ
jgi:hypothetical protein